MSEEEQKPSAAMPDAEQIKKLTEKLLAAEKLNDELRQMIGALQMTIRVQAKVLGG